MHEQLLWMSLGAVLFSLAGFVLLGLGWAVNRLLLTPREDDTAGDIELHDDKEILI